jgi:competence protein ComEA
VTAVAIALVVLAWIGKTAAARPNAESASVADADSGAASAATTGIAPPPATMPALSPASSPVPAPAPSHARASAEEPVYLNHASVEELRRLPGVGPKRAEAILALRQRLGRFQRVEDLLRVKGVGRGAVKKWRPLVRLDAPDAGSL